MENENENITNEEFEKNTKDYEILSAEENISNEDFLEENAEQNTESNTIAETSNTYNIDIANMSLEENQFNVIENNLKLISHTNYLLCAMLLTVFIYLFLRDLFERRKV